MPCLRSGRLVSRLRPGLLVPRLHLRRLPLSRPGSFPELLTRTWALLVPRLRVGRRQSRPPRDRGWFLLPPGRVCVLGRGFLPRGKWHRRRLGHRRRHGAVPRSAGRTAGFFLLRPGVRRAGPDQPRGRAAREPRPRSGHGPVRLRGRRRVLGQQDRKFLRRRHRRGVRLPLGPAPRLEPAPERWWSSGSRLSRSGSATRSGIVARRARGGVTTAGIDPRRLARTRQKLRWCRSPGSPERPARRHIGPQRGRAPGNTGRLSTGGSRIRRRERGPGPGGASGGRRGDVGLPRGGTRRRRHGRNPRFPGQRGR